MGVEPPPERAGPVHPRMHCQSRPQCLAESMHDLDDDAINRIQARAPLGHSRSEFTWCSTQESNWRFVQLISFDSISCGCLAVALRRDDLMQYDDSVHVSDPAGLKTGSKRQ